MVNHMGKRIWFLLSLLCLFAAVSCGSEEQEDKSRVYNIYVINKDETKILPVEYTVRRKL